MAMKRYSAFPKALTLLEPYHHIVQCHNRSLIGGGVLTLLQRCSWYILQSQPTEQLYSVCHLKAALMNMQHSLIYGLMLYEYKLEAIKNSCYIKGEGTSDHTTETRWFKKLDSGSKFLNNQARSSRPKTVGSEAMLLAIEANMVVGFWRVLEEFSITQSSVVCHLYDVGKSIRCCQIVLHATKILQNFDSAL